MELRKSTLMLERGIHTRGGVITERNADYCTVRTRLPAGIISPEQLRGLADIADEFGINNLQLTVRQTIEYPHMDPDHLDRIAELLARNQTPIGAAMDEVVNITACPGLDRCVFANIEPIPMAKELDARLFGKEMPIKIRISISACPNACTSPMMNEIGVVGRIQPIRTPGLCTGCGTCVEYCREGALTIKSGVITMDPDLCVECGTCIRSCPFQLIKSSGVRYLITVGGRRGRHPTIGRELISVQSSEDAMNVVEKVVQWVYRRAWSSRLLSEQLDEIGFEQFKQEINDQFSESGSN
ncbi:MAG TPA: 4Fe-4S dicluster domain-containing protein [Methanoregulaceae archaeon]|nr:4Fe-4S dicluster domain-containing protein [Methanoregulaceae archaeon]